MKSESSTAANKTNAKSRTYLTKSRYALAVECPTKLRFAADKSYANQSIDNDFLRALAEFGHQVGGLAKTLLGQGTEITETDHDAAVARTNELLAAGDCLLFEAAVRWENCFVRIDLLQKVGNEIQIYEVKAKSFDDSKGIDQIVGKRGG